MITLASVEWLQFVDEGTRYVGMVRPRDLTRALAAAQPELDSQYHLAHVPPAQPQISSDIYAGHREADGRKVRHRCQGPYRENLDHAVRHLSSTSMAGFQPVWPVVIEVAAFDGGLGNRPACTMLAIAADLK